MSHDTHQQTDSRPTRLPSRSSLWFVIVLVGLFIGAVNFVNVMGHSGEEHETTAHNEATEKASSGHGYNNASTEQTQKAVETPSTDTTEHSSK